MRNWSKEFNALPIEIRTICCAIECLTRIQQLHLEKERLVRRYHQSISEINEHISACEMSLLEFDNAGAKEKRK